MKLFIMLLIDVALIAVATLLALALRYDFDLPLYRLIDTVPLLVFSLLYGAAAIVVLGQHRAIWRLSAGSDFRRALGVALITVVGATLSTFAYNQLDGIARSLPLLQFGTVCALMLGARFVARSVREVWTPGTVAPGPANTQSPPVSALLIGINSLSELYMRATAEWADERVEIVGILGRNEQQIGRQVHSHRVLGTPEDLLSVLRDLEVAGISVDRLIVAMPLNKMTESAREAIVEVQRTSAIDVEMLPERIGLGQFSRPRFDADDMRTLSFADFDLDLVRGRRYFKLKRAVDFTVALVLLVLGAPFIVLGALLVAIDVGFPIVFCQRRPGRLGKPFNIYKFRTMAGAYDRNGNRLRDEERSSWIGKFLRRSRLDELLQLYNVLIGEMSFVGPRPLLPVDQSAAFKARLLVRPGITGYAQVEGGRVISAADKGAMDVWYVQHASLSLDLRILASTVPMIIFGDRVNRNAIEMAWRELASSGVAEALRRSNSHGGSAEAMVEKMPFVGDRRTA